MFGDGSLVVPPGGFSRKVLLLVKAGKGVLELEGKRLELHAGAVVFIEAGREFRVVGSSGLVGFYLEHEDRYLEHFLLHYPLARGLSLYGELVCLELMRERLLLVLERLRVLVFELERDGGFEHLKLVFSLLLLDMVEHRFGVVRHVGPERDLRGEFAALLEASFRAERSTLFYARRLGISDRKLNALCREWYGGKMVFGVVMDRLVSEAEYLLLGTDMAIKAIAYELGFSSSENFGMYFRRAKGLGPMAFRLSGARPFTD
jgi:AraC-like DNA-binding protein